MVYRMRNSEILLVQLELIHHLHYRIIRTNDYQHIYANFFPNFFGNYHSNYGNGLFQ